MTGAERPNLPAHLNALPARSPLSPSPSPSFNKPSQPHSSSSPSFNKPSQPHSSSSPSFNKPSQPRASSSTTTNQLSNRSTLAQRGNHHPHFETSNFSADLHFPNTAFGATPNYELPPDGMFNDARFDPSSSASSYWLSENRSRSVPPRIAVDSSNTTRRANSRRAVPAIDTSGPPHSRRESLMQDAEKRPTSPHITSATPTGRHHHHHFASEKSNSLSSSVHEHDSHRIRQNVQRVASPSLLNSGIGRAAVSAAQSIMDAMAGRSSPVAARFKHPLAQDRHSSSDDEAGKGHGRKAAASVAVRFTPSLYHPRHSQSQHHAHFDEKATSPYDTQAPPPHGVSTDLAWRASLSESRRATPAAYRPPLTSPARKRGSVHIDQQATGDDKTDLHHHKSAHSSILIGSPIVIPQARRGAIRLGPRRKRRLSRQVGPQGTLRQSIYLLIANIVHFVRLIFNPAEALRRFREYCIDTRISIYDAFRDPQTGVRSYYPPWLQAYVPLLIWLGISLSSTALVITFHTKVFIGLDRMSSYLQGLGLWGKVMLGSLIFLTTFPPLPLYSTLIMLCGFTFGLWQGFVISYIAALSGAIVVFTLSRSLLREWMVGLLDKSGGLKKVVRAIEKQPKLLFLVRLAPYPYNLMNTLLASSPTLTLRTYVTCTALALPKLLIHTGLGTSIKNFAAYNGAIEGQSKQDAEASQTAENVKKWAGLVGVGLCVGIMIYLLSVARRAVDELDDEIDDGYEDVLLDQDDEEYLSSDYDEQDDSPDSTYGGDEGVDMRQRAGPSTLGFRNGYAPITCSPEERLRQSMRHPQPMPLPLLLPGSTYEQASGSGSFEGRISSVSSGSVGNHSIDLADKIAEMEAHAENMQFEVPLHNADAGQVIQSPRWSPMVEGLEESVDTGDTIRKEKPFLLDQSEEELQQTIRNGRGANHGQHDAHVAAAQNGAPGGGGGN